MAVHMDDASELCRLARVFIGVVAEKHGIIYGTEVANAWGPLNDKIRAIESARESSDDSDWD